MTVVGGKLTTYRRMAQDAVDAAVAHGGLTPAGASPRPPPAGRRGSPRRARPARAPARLVRRYGTDAALVLATARRTGLGDDELLAPVSDRVPVTLAELVCGVTHEGALDVDDLLDRRTRVGLVPVDRAAAEPLARRALELASQLV